MKKIIKFFALLSLLLVLCAPALAAQKSPSLVDHAKILKPEEQKKIASALDTVEKKYGVRVAVVTVPSTQNEETGKFANAVLDKLYRDGKNGNMVLVMNMGDRKWYLATDKAMAEKITTEKGIPYLSGKFLPEIKKNDYANAFASYAQTSDELLAYYAKEGKAYDPDSGFKPLNLAIAFAIALCIGFLYRKHLIASMSNVMPALAAGVYLDKDSFQLTEKEDTYLYMTVARVSKEKKKAVPDSSTDEHHGGGGGGF